MRTGTLLLMLLASLFNTLAGAAQDVSWSAVKHQIRSAFPEVEQLSTDTLAARLARSDGPVPLLLDTRTEAEFEVSHLPGARRLDPDTPDLSPLADLPLDTPIVTYCSVGYRSSAMARRLQEAGFRNVANLEGSIFAWANEGRPVYRGGERVPYVHPYNALWGRLLNEDLRWTPKLQNSSGR